MVATFKSKTLITDLYSMNPAGSRGYYFFTILYIEAALIFVLAHFLIVRDQIQCLLEMGNHPGIKVRTMSNFWALSRR
jgi:hypothetical protein